MLPDGIEPVSLISQADERMRTDKFEACVLPLADWTGSESILEAARTRSQPPLRDTVLAAARGMP